MLRRKDISLENSSDHVVEQLLGKDWGELEMIEVEGRILFPAEIHRRKKGGKFEAVKVLLRIPREPELRKARVEARQIALNEGLDLDRDKDLIENLENICILCDACRNPDPPLHEPFDPFPREFEKNYDLGSIDALWDKLNRLSEVINPRPQGIDAGEMMALILAISEARNTSPLAVFGPDAQDSFILTMVDRLVSCMESRSSSESSEPSTPG